MTGSPRPTAAAVAGRVVDREGRPVPSAVIHWLQDRDGDGAALPRVRFFPVAVTDPGGRFRTAPLPAVPGRLVPDYDAVLVQDHSGRAGHGVPVDPSVRNAGDVELLLPFTPADYARLRGVVRRPDGSRHAGCILRLLHPDRAAPVRASVSDAGGEFLWKWIRPGTYALAIGATTEIAGGVVPVTLQGGKLLTVTLGTSPRPPGANHAARVRCCDVDGAPVRGVTAIFEAEGFEAPPVLTDRDGVASRDDLPVPARSVRVEREGWFPAGAMTAEGAPPPDEFRVTVRPQRVLHVAPFDAEDGEPVPWSALFLDQGVHDNARPYTSLPPGPGGPPGAATLPLLVADGPYRLDVEAPGYLPATVEGEVPPGGPVAPLRVALRRA